jgi:hypothetical protein
MEVENWWSKELGSVEEYRAPSWLLDLIKRLYKIKRGNEQKKKI